jgi:hypothetical protein
MLRFGGFGRLAALDVTLEGIVQERSYRSDGGQLSDVVPTRGDCRSNDVGAKLKFESQNQPRRKASPRFAACSDGSLPGEYRGDENDKSFDSADRNDNRAAEFDERGDRVRKFPK